jgi:uncharacterized phage-like protein YoqJ
MGKVCAFIGHRPSKLQGGYDWYLNNNIELGRIIRKKVEVLVREKGVDTFISGGALCVDQMAFQIVYKLKKTKYPYLHLILAMPFKNQDND